MKKIKFAVLLLCFVVLLGTVTSVPAAYAAEPEDFILTCASDGDTGNKMSGILENKDDTETYQLKAACQRLLLSWRAGGPDGIASSPSSAPPQAVGGAASPEMRLNLSNAIKLTNKFQKKEKSLDKGKKMCGKALKTRLIFRGRAHEIHS